MFRKIHDRMAYLPFLWVGTTSLCIVMAIIKLGHIPCYGADPDPTALGFELYTFLNLLLFMVVALSIIIWPAVLLAYFTMYGKAYKINWHSVAAYIAGVITIYLLLRYGPMDWYLD
jgi:hypothetical protein